MRARLNRMSAEEQFSCICDLKMAEKMDRIIRLADGEILHRKEYVCGVVLRVRKR